MSSTSLFLCVIDQNDIDFQLFVQNLCHLFFIDNIDFYNNSSYPVNAMWVDVSSSDRFNPTLKNRYFIILLLNKEFVYNKDNYYLHGLVVLAHYIDMNGWSFTLRTRYDEFSINPLQDLRYYKYIDLPKFSLCIYDTVISFFDVINHLWLSFIWDEYTTTYLFEYLHFENSSIGYNTFIWRQYFLEFFQKKEFYYFIVNSRIQPIVKRELLHEHFNLYKKYSSYSHFKKYWSYKQRSERSILSMNLRAYLDKITNLCIIHYCTLLFFELIIIKPHLNSRKVYYTFKKLLSRIDGLEHVLVYKKKNDVNYSCFIMSKSHKEKQVLKTLSKIKLIKFLNKDISTLDLQKKNYILMAINLNSLLYGIYTHITSLAISIHCAYKNAFTSMEYIHQIIKNSKKSFFKMYAIDIENVMSCLYFDYSFLKNYNQLDFTFLPVLQKKKYKKIRINSIL